MQTGYDIHHLFGEAEHRWLKPVEVYFILRNFNEDQLTHQVPQKPPSGSLLLLDKRVLKYFRKDGHNWRRRKHQRTIAEGHEKLKVENVEVLNCYYAHGEENRNFQRRSYWMLQQENEHIVLVHYRDTGVGRQDAKLMTQVLPLPSFPFSPFPSLSATQLDLPILNCDLYKLLPNQSSLSSVEISSSDVILNQGMNYDISEHRDETNCSSGPESSQARQLNDDDRACDTCIDDNNFNAVEYFLPKYNLSGLLSSDSDNLFWQQFSDNQCPVAATDVCDIDSAQSLTHLESLELDGDYPNIFMQDDMGILLEDDMRLTIAHKQKFTIQEISPDWCYTSEGAKVIIIGSFLCDSSECSWACMFGNIEVPVQIIRDGVIRCHAPPQLAGKVTLCITSGNRESCSEVREFDYRAKPMFYKHNNPPEMVDKSSEELSLLVRFVQMILSDQFPNGDVSESRRGQLSKSTTSDDLWNQVIDFHSVDTSMSVTILDRLLQELLKDKLRVWLSSRTEKNDQKICSVSKEEQGIIHMAAGLGYDWALQPILNFGVNANFRDSKGWTALHWAAKFGRENMVAALIASGASARAITDPSSHDPEGKTAASIAILSGHMGLAGYLSEMELTSHLSSLTLQESELSKGSAALEAEQTVNSLSKECPYINEDQCALKDTITAIHNATLAASRIQAVFRAHSFRKSMMKEAAEAIARASEDDYYILESDIEGLSAASKLAFRNPRDSGSAALSIQKKYRGWKGRKDFNSIRQKAIKIQAHFRGYQARKRYNVSWALGVLEKIVLRWYRRGDGLRGFNLDTEIIDECDEEEILRVFRTQKVEAAIKEAVSRVLSMIESPTARQQYSRILDKYRQATVKLQVGDSDTASSSRGNKCSVLPFAM